MMTGHNLNLRSNNLTFFTRSHLFSDTNVNAVPIQSTIMQEMTRSLYRVTHDPIYNAIEGMRYSMGALSDIAQLGLDLSISPLNLVLELINFLSWCIGMLAVFYVAFTLIAATAYFCCHYEQTKDWLIETYEHYFIETNEQRLENFAPKLLEDVPTEYLCLINKTIMTEPVYDPRCPQHKFEKRAIAKALKIKEVNPFTKTPLTLKALVSDEQLKQEIAQYVTDAVNKKCGLQIL